MICLTYFTFLQPEKGGGLCVIAFQINTVLFVSYGYWQKLGQAGTISGMNLLFENPESEVPSDETGQIVAVAINANVWDTYDYIFPGGLGQPFVGQRVRVPFGRGNRTSVGFITELNRPATARNLKAVREIVDHQPQLDGKLLELARWISHYYLTPLGMTLSACLPSAVGKRLPKSQTVAFLHSEPTDWPGALGLRQRKVLDELLEARKQGEEPLPLELLVRHSQAGRDTVRRLVQRGLIRTETREVKLDDLPCQIEPDSFPLNEDQQKVLTALEPKVAAQKFSVTLLRGVTGSGKTEVYVRAIRKVIQAGKQAIMLAPEIALTTQTLQRLLKRLPCVAVLHSGLTSAQRSFYWDQIRQGHASVIVGPRSAIFAPARNVGLIIVDEEHESSYKQDTAPRYHGRDVAVKRASLEDVPVILGSATPSMESMQNANAGRYDLLELNSRVKGLAMPKLEIVHLRREMTPGRIELLGQTLTHRMAGALDRREQIILLMNRRGYASYVFCPVKACQWMLQCDDCVRPMVYHQAIQLATCHHCNKTATVPPFCPACGGKIILFGYGIQRIEDELARKFPTAAVARMDSDTMTSPKQFQRVLGEFGEGKIDILLGTQMVAKGLDFPRVSLVGVVSADTALAINDFRSSERTFQMIVQVAGRAGRSDTPGQVIVQTLHADDPSIHFAEHHDYVGFAKYELADRQEANLPPFSRMVRFVIRHEKMDVASQAAGELGTALRHLLPAGQVIMIGPQQAEFIKLRNQFRFHILVITNQPGLVQNALAGQLGQITRDIHAEIIADVDPINIL